MPLFAKLVAGIAALMIKVFSLFYAETIALKLAAYVTWIAVVGAMVATTAVCIGNIMNLLSAFISGGGAGVAGQYIAMGLGMFIPDDAGAVMGCVASVWLTTTVYKLQKTGITVFGS